MNQAGSSQAVPRPTRDGRPGDPAPDRRRGPGSPGLRAAHVRDTRRALLTAARELFAANGFQATRTEEIVQRAGLTRGALYHHFRDKEDLFRAVYEEVTAEVTALAAATVGGPARQRLGPLPGQQRGLPRRRLHQSGLPADRADRRPGGPRVELAVRAGGRTHPSDHGLPARRRGRRACSSPSPSSRWPTCSPRWAPAPPSTWPTPTTPRRPGGRSARATSGSSPGSGCTRPDHPTDRDDSPDPPGPHRSDSDRTPKQRQKGPPDGLGFLHRTGVPRRSWTGLASSSPTRSSRSTSSTRTSSSTPSTTSCGPSSIP